jgi:hypothetical protein
MFSENEAKNAAISYRKRLEEGDTTVVNDLKGLYEQWKPMLKMAGYELNDDLLSKLDAKTLCKLCNDNNISNNMESAMKIFSIFLQGKK